MKITGQGPVSWNRVRAAYQQPADVKGQGGVDKAFAGADTVQLSAGSKLIRELKARLEEVNDTRAGRVEAIRAALAAGTYKISLEEVAAAILKEMGR
ncbi:Anti-sigma-28 factor, FlgM [Neomoorella glycerini]|uniref:Negative regulator of flagellin synthesis n=1 Tax=Neomoorella glycerini TaxID=55779 RepID=A0A6I5ZS08_9FIRM|nr:flagellar biosynthesis anti-sigma factor FlgM [Moorella glycerini]QGP92803.1 Anti-sigma-28 factor, FlgM [Moorella glycerini]